jgi:GWxTD domain-containing protein
VIAPPAFAPRGLGPSRAAAQYPNPSPPTQPETPVPGTSPDRPRFSVDGTVEPGGGVPIVRLDYRLARAELLFERRMGGYHAAYEVSVVFYKEKGGRQVTGDTFVRELDVKTYAETRPIGNDVIDHVELSAPPDRYDVQVVIRDLVAERSSGTRIALEVPKQAAGPIWFTDLSFGNVKRGTAQASDPRAALIPNPARRYSEDVTSLAVYGEIVDSRPAAPSDSGYRIQFRVLNDQQERVLERDTTLARAGGRTPFLLRPPTTSLVPGSYRFLVELKAPLLPQPGGKRLPIRREKSFEVVQSVASIVADPKTTFKILEYIADSDERKEMKAADTPESQRDFWERFWKRRDPSPDTPENEAMEEFYRRIQYANQHFSVGGPGWMTDMGKVYIKYGQPDEVVRSPFNIDRHPEEIWYYYALRKTFFFVDHTEFGRYDLDSRSSPL